MVLVFVAGKRDPEKSGNEVEDGGTKNYVMMY
jgi:hypothetical protein